MQKHSFKEQERHRREQEILRVASQLLMERGYSNLNMDDLADVVGISKPTLYHHFKSKEELVSRVMIQSYMDMEEQLADKLTGSPLERITKIMRHILKTRFTANNVTGNMDQEMLWSVMRTNPVLIERRKQAHEGLSKLVDQAKELGEITTAIPTPIVVRAMFCLQGVFKDSPLRDEMASSEERLDAGIDAVVRVFLHGVVSTEAERAAPKLKSHA